MVRKHETRSIYLKPQENFESNSFFKTNGFCLEEIVKQLSSSNTRLLLKSLLYILCKKPIANQSLQDCSYQSEALNVPTAF